MTTPTVARLYSASTALRGAALITLLALGQGGCAGSDSPSEASAERMVSTAHVHGPGTLTEGPRKIAVLDDCRPGDPWPGGCSLPDGNVSMAQFQADLPRGHASWRNEPSYLIIEQGKFVKVANGGGRGHSFTEVAAYGNGVAPPLNTPGQPQAPECLNAATLAATTLAPGEATRLEGLTPGIHKFQCCFHPWMVAEIRVH